MRGASGAMKQLEARQKSRQTRAGRDALDRALMDLATYFARRAGGVGGRRRAPPRGQFVAANHPDMAEKVAERMAAHVAPDKLLRCIEAVLDCREALAINVKPKFAVDAMVGDRRAGPENLRSGGQERSDPGIELGDGWGAAVDSCRSEKERATLAQSVEQFTRNE